MAGNGFAVVEMEKEMWKAVVAKDVKRFEQLVKKEAVMICGGLKCSGEEYKDFIQDFDIYRYEISDMAVVYEDENCVQLYYIVKTFTDAKESDLYGVFYVTSLWKRQNDVWQLIFNMDSRLYDATTAEPI